MVDTIYMYLHSIPQDKRLQWKAVRERSTHLDPKIPTQG